MVQKYKMINLLDILQDDATQINKDFVSYYQNIHGVTIPIEVQKIISSYDEIISFNNEKYMLKSPEKWCDFLDFFGFDFNETGIIPLLSFNEYETELVCYDPKEKEYFFKELGLGTESDGYKSIIELLNNKRKIINGKEKK